MVPSLFRIKKIIPACDQGSIRSTVPHQDPSAYDGAMGKRSIREEIARKLMEGRSKLPTSTVARAGRTRRQRPALQADS
jgi:hypothetical protein